MPGARAAVQHGKRIGVIATPATAASNAYRLAIQEVDPNAQVWQVSCPEFVPLIEQNRIHDSYTLEVAKGYLQPLLQKNIDTLVYGCTHYRHLEPILSQLLPPSGRLIDPARYVVKAAEKELELMGIKNTQAPLPTRFTVSGSPEIFSRLSRQWLGYQPPVEKVCLPSLKSVSLPLELRE